MRDALMEIVPGGVDIAFEVVGNPELVAATFELVRPHGLCVMVGSPGPGSVIPIAGTTLFMGRRLAGCVGGDNIPARGPSGPMSLPARGVDGRVPRDANL